MFKVDDKVVLDLGYTEKLEKVTEITEKGYVYISNTPSYSFTQEGKAVDTKRNISIRLATANDKKYFYIKKLKKKIVFTDLTYEQAVEINKIITKSKSGK